jgi:hypothetical protein
MVAVRSSWPRRALVTWMIAFSSTAAASTMVGLVVGRQQSSAQAVLVARAPLAITGVRATCAAVAPHELPTFEALPPAPPPTKPTPPPTQPSPLPTIIPSTLPLPWTGEG